MDNALKYADNDSPIEMSLKKYKKNIILTCINSSNNLDDNIEHLFDRFYRGDKSHNSKNFGFGIGLSLAKSICEVHGGSISANKLSDKIIKFEAILS